MPGDGSHSQVSAASPHGTDRYSGSPPLALLGLTNVQTQFVSEPSHLHLRYRGYRHRGMSLRLGSAARGRATAWSARSRRVSTYLGHSLSTWSASTSTYAVTTFGTVPLSARVTPGSRPCLPTGRDVAGAVGSPHRKKPTGSGSVSRRSRWSSRSRLPR